MARDIAKRLCQRLCGELKRRARLGIGSTLCQDFDEQDAERPHVASGGKRVGCGFGRVVGSAFCGGFAKFAGGEEAVGRKFHLIRGGQNVRGLEARVHEALRVQIAESIEHGAEHVARFGGSKSALRENLRKIFFGVFHDHVEQVHVRETAAATLIQLK